MKRTIIPYTQQALTNAKRLRKNMTYSEVKLWMELRNGNMMGYDFDRQKPMLNYIVDFYVKTLGLIIEIDGWSHNNKEIYDELRQQYLESLGLTIFRITDFDVRNNIAVVMKDLENFIIEHYKY